MTETADFDLVVLGGGPGGSALATFVAMQGHSVLLLEEQRFPRHQLGESLLPATIHGICPLLGVADEIARAGFPRKRGGTFRWGKDPEPWTFAFSKIPESPTGYAYQVRRADFDKILLDNAARKGVDVRQEHIARGLVSENGRVTGVRFVDEDGQERRVSARYVADAQGHRGQLHKHVGERVYSKFFQNIALYAYFENGKRLPPPNEGNILSCAFDQGWFWYIPLSPTLTSVGAVVAKEHAEGIARGEGPAFNAFVERCPLIRDYLGSARRVTEGMYGVFRVRKDYSYCNTRFWAPGLVLVGDAACFIDPVFSSGVHLATYSALLAARSINTALEGALPEGVVFEEFERRYRREFGNFYQFLVAFYDMQQEAESYFWEARKILNSEEQSNEAFVNLVAGVSSPEEPLFSGAGKFFESRRGLGDWFQDMLSREAEGVSPVNRLPTFPTAGFDPARFMRGFNAEIAQLQTQAVLGAKRLPEQPLTPIGLIPSPDGFHWYRLDVAGSADRF